MTRGHCDDRRRCVPPRESIPDAAGRARGLRGAETPEAASSDAEWHMRTFALLQHDWCSPPAAERLSSDSSVSGTASDACTNGSWTGSPGGVDGRLCGGRVQHPGACCVYWNRDSSRRRRADRGRPGLGCAWGMSRIMIWCAGLALAGAVAVCGQPAAVRAAGSWGKAIEVPGLGALNTSGAADVVSVSCASAGNCAAGGQYGDRHGQQGFAASERRGRWGKAIEVPGSAALNADGRAAVNSVSCPSAGNCVAGGYYTEPGDYNQAFVVSERGGTWGTAIHLPFTGNGYYPNGYGTINSVSCASVGNCAAAGYDNGQAADNTVESAFVVDEKNGHWGKVRQVPGLAALNTGSPNIRRGRLHRPPPSLPGVHGRRAERRVGHGDRGARPAGPEHGRGRPRLLGVVRPGGHLRGRRVVPGPPPSLPGVHREPDRIRRAAL
jgi:hypothetical protein